MFKYLAVSTVLLASASSFAGLFETMTSDQVSPSQIYQAISIEYTEDLQRLDTRSTFRNGNLLGTTIRMVAPSQVSVNGRAVDAHQNWVGETNYKTQEFGALQPRLALAWTDSRGHTYRNDVEIRAAHLAGVPATERRPSGRRSRHGQSLPGPGPQLDRRAAPERRFGRSLDHRPGRRSGHDPLHG